MRGWTERGRMRGAERAVAAPLREAWYYAAAEPAAAAPAGCRAKMMLGEPVLIGRDRAGAPSRCATSVRTAACRSAPAVSTAREIECCYHGWRFDTDGRCTAIPSLAPGQRIRPGRIA